MGRGKKYWKRDEMRRARGKLPSSRHENEFSIYLLDNIYPVLDVHVKGNVVGQRTSVCPV